MIEAMEQRMLNNLKSNFLKNEKLRKDISIDATSDALRVICSSRSSFYPIFNSLKLNINKPEYILKLKSKISEVYDFILLDCVNDIISSYENSNIKDIKKKELYINQIPLIKESLSNIKTNVCEQTLNKLLVFHNIYIGGTDNE